MAGVIAAPEPLTQSDLTAGDRQRVQLGLSLSTQDARDAYMAVLAEKWGWAGWLNAEDARTDQAKRFHDELNRKWRAPELKTTAAKMAMALILENQARFQREHQKRVPIVTEGGQQFALVQDGETSTGDESLPTRVVMPIIRRIYAVVTQNDISVVQPMSGPSSYVFWLDFIRAADAGGLSDSSNLLSLEYNAFLTPELGVPGKAKLQLTQKQINAVKLMLGVTWSTEAEEDAKALLNLNIEAELVNAMGEEFVRDLFMRHITEIYNAASGSSPWDPSVGYNLPSPWTTNLPAVQLPNVGSGMDLTNYKQAVYGALIDADTQFLRANRRPAAKIMCGYGMAGFLQKINTATGATSPNPGDMASVGFSNYGQYAARFEIVGTEFLPDGVGILYLPNPDPLHAGHVYAPYVPVTAGPKVYADYDSTTGQFLNKDAWTRTLRERSASLVTKPYSFQLITAPSGGFGQYA